jgi:hypothetical protein
MLNPPCMPCLHFVPLSRWSYLRAPYLVGAMTNLSDNTLRCRGVQPSPDIQAGSKAMNTLMFRGRSRLFLTILATVWLSGVAGVADALGTASTGQIGQVLVTGSADGAPGIEDFRVFLTGNPVICNGNTWAYVNISDANYNAIVETSSQHVPSRRP